MTIDQHIAASIIRGVFGFTWNQGKKYRVKHMKPEQFEMWRKKQLSEIKKEAAELTSLVDDKKLRKLNLTRWDQERIFEVILRNKRGVKMSQFLLEGMNIKGMDLRHVKGLKQKHIERAIGNASTQLPDYLHAPQHWK